MLTDIYLPMLFNMIFIYFITYFLSKFLLNKTLSSHNSEFVVHLNEKYPLLIGYFKKNNMSESEIFKNLKKSVLAQNPFSFSIIMQLYFIFFTDFTKNEYQLSFFEMILVATSISFISFIVAKFLNINIIDKNVALGEYVPEEWLKIKNQDFNGMTYYQLYKKSYEEQISLYQKAIEKNRKKIEDFSILKKESFENKELLNSVEETISLLEEKIEIYENSISSLRKIIIKKMEN